MRAIWKGSVSFGLVNIPIALWPAVKREELSFRLLRKSDLSPVNYKRVAEADGREVPWGEIVKGYEYEKGRFIVLRDEDFRRVDIEAAQQVDILDFVELTEINPMYFAKPYYMEALKGAAKAYHLLREALQNAGKIGIAKVVIRSRQHLAAVKPQGQNLVLELMHFADELTKPVAVTPAAPVSKGEMAMATTLIGKMTVKWDPARYTDDYRSALLGLIESRIKAGGRVGKAPAPRAKAPGNVVDLVQVLRESLAETKKLGREKKVRRPPGKRKAA